MTFLVESHQTSAPAKPAGAYRCNSLRTGVLLESVFGTSAGIPPAICLDSELVTTAPGVRVTTVLLGVAEEMRSLRDRISSRGLTRQDIARAIGVDRRSLSGWVRGEIRPTEDRVDKLRLLARLVTDIDAERPGRARWLLLNERQGQPLLDRVGSAGPAILATWRSAVPNDYTTRVNVRTEGGEHPLWERAAEALATGALPAPSNTRTIRRPETYEMDLGEATEFDEQAPRSRRKSYR